MPPGLEKKARHKRNEIEAKVNKFWDFLGFWKILILLPGLQLKHTKAGDTIQQNVRLKQTEQLEKKKEKKFVLGCVRMGKTTSGQWR
jgi:hypothetical protein